MIEGPRKGGFGVEHMAQLFSASNTSTNIVKFVIDNEYLNQVISLCCNTSQT